MDIANQAIDTALPNDMADAVELEVATGACAAESKVAQNGWTALQTHDRTAEYRLQNLAGPAFDAIRADPTRADTADGVRARLATEHGVATTNA